MQTKHKLDPGDIALNLDQLPRPVDWENIFGNKNLLELEIGMGKGTFITDQAKAHPEKNYLGIEWANWFWKYASDRLRRNECTNARTVCGEAAFFLTEFVPAESISVLHIYFPDPWHKKRHHKRRLIQPKFLELVEKILRPGGQLRVVTDHEGYFLENIQPAITGSHLKIVEYLPPGNASGGEWVGTNFERKYAREGRPFYAIAAVKDLSHNLATELTKP
ncbi:MAG TPA: tRNA (guanosine(46)-N7)-methyltransferase TrmB [Tepidisphaeraceae bacterium]|jgi:tRNA (guanine-N7-)-methyltransferase